MQSQAWNAVAELAAACHGCFTRSQAAFHGVDHRRISTALASGFIASRGRDVFVFGGHATSLRTEIRAATLLGRGSVASHRSAAHLLGFDGFDRPSRVPVEVSVRAPRTLIVPDELPVVWHRPTTLTSEDLVTVAGIPCTSKYRTLVDLGCVTDDDMVLRALIGAHRDGLSLPVLQRTALRLHRPGQRGTKLVLQLLAEIGESGALPESWLEEVLHRMLRHPALPPIQRQYRLTDGDGRTLARFDMAIVEVKLAIEGHSRANHFGPIAESGDAQRDLTVARRGWQTVYLGWFAQYEPTRVVEAIVDIVRQRQPLAA